MVIPDISRFASQKDTQYPIMDSDNKKMTSVTGHRSRPKNPSTPKFSAAVVDDFEISEGLTTAEAEALLKIHGTTD